MLSRFEHFIYDLTEIDLYWHRISSEIMKNYGLKGSQAVYFTKLLDHPEGLTSVQLCSMCGKDKADVSRDLKQLEQAELVERIAHGSSLYRASIRLTARGYELTKAISQKAQQAVDRVGRNLSDQERESFYKALDDIARNLKELSEKGLEN